MTSREFNQHVSQAQRQADIAPVIITKHGKPSYVLMCYKEYQKHQKSTVEQSAKEALLSLNIDPNVADIDFEAPKRSTAQRQPVDFGEI